MAAGMEYNVDGLVKADDADHIFVLHNRGRLSTCSCQRSCCHTQCQHLDFVINGMQVSPGSRVQEALIANTKFIAAHRGSIYDDRNARLQAYTCHAMHV